MKLRNTHIILCNITTKLLEPLFLGFILLIRPITRPKRRLNELRSKQPLKIIHYLEVIWEGGPVPMVLLLARFLHKKGYEQVIVCRSDGKNREGLNRQFGELGVLGVEIVNTDLPTYWPVFDIIKILRLAKVFKGKKADILHIHKAHWYREKTPILSAQIAGIPIIINYELNAIPISRSKYINWVKSFVDNYLVDFSMINSSNGVKILIEEFKISNDKISYIPNFRKVDKNTRGREITLDREYELHSSYARIGVVARLHPQKGYEYLLEAIPIVINDFPDAKFLFVGDGPLKQELIQKSKKLNIDKNVRFLGYINLEQLPSFYHRLNIGVLPSLHEGMPGSVLEYMANGLPVVATSVMGTKDLVVDGLTGLLVPPKDPYSLAKAINKLLENPGMAEEMGRNGKERIEKEFSVEVVGEKIHNIYSSLYSV